MNRRIAFITGASSGIGEATARALAKEKYNLVLCARRHDKIKSIGEELEKEFGIATHTIQLDVRDRGAVDSAVQALPVAWHNIDVLVNNAGLGLGRAPFQVGSPDDWDTMIDTNIKGFLYVTHALLPKMIARKSGHIVNIASIAGVQTYPNGNVYSATKFAVHALSDSMRIDLLPTGIKVTTINPGRVQTNFPEILSKGDQTVVTNFSRGMELLQASDIAEGIVFAVTRPKNVVVAELTITPLAQADANNMLRKE